MFDINKEYKKKIDKVFCDFAKKDINKENATHSLYQLSFQIKNNNIPKKRELKNNIFEIKRFINK